MGKVYLIGAGPGDEELITIKAVRALKKCTAVLYDRLVNESILGYLEDDCKIYYCGKEPGCHYKTQDEINDILVEMSKGGHTVGRVKGGDPYMFGRGSEESLRLYEEGIDFEVIPGITSPLSVLNYGGIPATHRKIAQGLHIFTGRSAEKLDMDWSVTARLKGTLIFLMGLENLGNISQNLIENGMDKNIPCGVIMRGTTSKQKKVTGTLQDISHKVAEAGLKSPCIIAIGEVVNFSDRLNWYEKKPLFGYNICITRSKEQSAEIKQRLLDLGAEVTEINTIKIKNTSYELDKYVDRLSDYDYIAITSVNGANTFFDHLRDIGYDIRRIKAAFAAIGPATANTIKDRGIIPEIMAEKFAAEDLFDEMKKYVKEGDRVLLPRSREARPYLYNALKDKGYIVDEAPIYEIVEGNILNKDKFKEVDIVIFTSPSTVRNLISMVGIDEVKEKRCIAIGPITCKELETKGISADVCDDYTMDGIINKLICCANLEYTRR